MEDFQPMNIRQQIGARSQGRMFLLTGLSGSGKSTIGQMLTDYLNMFGTRSAHLLDGDSTRAFFEGDKSFSEADRDCMTKRMAFAAYALTQKNIDVVMANIAAKKITRDFLRLKFSDYIEIYFDIDVDTLRAHDIKGIYKLHGGKENPQLIGVDLPYEVPGNPDLVLKPYKESPDESMERIIEYISKRGPVLGTKADTLSSLSGYLKKSKILPQYVTTWDEYSRDSVRIAKNIRAALGSGPYAVRSSCRGEDTKQSSMAGAFVSCLDIPDEQPLLCDAIKKVVSSYESKNMDRAHAQQVLIQPMVQSVRMSGVVCTRHKESDSPYYVINFEQSGDTASVTSGRGGRVAFISRFLRDNDLGVWKTLVSAIRELELLFPKFPLEVEFAICEDGQIVLFQCRALLVQEHHVSLEDNAAALIEELKLRFDRFQDSQMHLPGGKVILSDMADWNPSEMIGERPSTLAYSLYRELVTDRTWHEARTSQGYFDVIQGNLMVSMARKPYIDLQLSFSSLTPALISNNLRNILVRSYLSKIETSRYLHDKIEFEVAYTCYDFNVESQLRNDPFLCEMDKKDLLDALRDMTNQLVCNADSDMAEDMRKISQLEAHVKQIERHYLQRESFWDCFNAAHMLIEHTRVLGVMPFARLARLAFIARSLLFSLVPAGLCEAAFCNRFLRSIPTIATQLSRDVFALGQGTLELKEFLKQYGHLRMNTYDITAPRYDQMPETIWYQHKPLDVQAYCGDGPAIGRLSNVDVRLAKDGLLFDSETLLKFIVSATQLREEAKFRFSRALSMLIEFLARGGQALGISREELQYATLPVLLRFRNPEQSSPAFAAKYLKQRFREKTKERSVFDLIRMPSVLVSGKDIDIVELEAAKPNFISDSCVTAPLAFLTPHTVPGDNEINGHVVLIENADPGFDWIFSHNIVGLITKYGGVASHMAIRCAEFGLPGAIGCGEAIFSRIQNATTVRLDCISGMVEAI